MEVLLIVRSIASEAEASVLCWFATVSPKGIPNVSPKEVFALLDEKSLVVADIASPNTVRNLQHNVQACVSFIDVFRQTGYKLAGQARVIPPQDDQFGALVDPLIDITQGHFNIRNVIHLHIETASPIVAPSYRVFPDKSLSDRIAGVLQVYRVKDAERMSRGG